MATPSLTSIQLETNLLIEARANPLTDSNQKWLVTIVSNESRLLIDLVNSPVDLSKKEARDDYKKSYFIHPLKIYKGNVSQVAKLARKYRAHFYDLMEKHGLNVSNFKNQTELQGSTFIALHSLEGNFLQTQNPLKITKPKKYIKIK